jgi:hypothetical protein
MFQCNDKASPSHALAPGLRVRVTGFVFCVRVLASALRVSSVCAGKTNSTSKTVSHLLLFSALPPPSVPQKTASRSEGKQRTNSRAGSPSCWSSAAPELWGGRKGRKERAGGVGRAGVRSVAWKARILARRVWARKTRNLTTPHALLAPRSPSSGACCCCC